MGIFTRGILRFALVVLYSLFVSFHVSAGFPDYFTSAFKNLTTGKKSPAIHSFKRSGHLLPAVKTVLAAPPGNPIVEFEIAETKVTEYPANPNIVYVAVTLDAPTTNTVTVPYNILGDANASDYTILNGFSP